MLVEEDDLDGGCDFARTFRREFQVELVKACKFCRLDIWKVEKMLNTYED